MNILLSMFFSRKSMISEARIFSGAELSYWSSVEILKAKSITVSTTFSKLVGSKIYRPILKNDKMALSLSLELLISIIIFLPMYDTCLNIF
jgi:ferredoxin-fold anticodon binding domain-containing protein